MRSSGVLIARSAEQASIEQLLATLREGLSGALVFRGERGIGKTALLRHAVEVSDGIQVAELAGVESETKLGYAGLQRVLLPFMNQADGLPKSQRGVLGSALGSMEGPPPSPFLLGLATLTLLANAAREIPLLCVIDDAQWLDQESLEVLAFVARRVHAERLGLVFAVAEPPRQPFLEGIPEVGVEALAPETAAEVLAALTQGRVDRPVAERIARQSGGNPLILTEVGRELAAGRVAPGLLLDDPLPVGERLEDHFRRTVSALPPDSRMILLLLAAQHGRSDDVFWRAADLAGLEPVAVQPAESAHLVELRPALHFRHSLIQSAVYHGAEPDDRRHAHVLLARASDSPDERDQRAWHVAAATLAPDEEVAAELETCSRKARGRGGFLGEAAFLARAAELSADPSARGHRFLAAAEAATLGGAPHRAEQLLDAGAPWFEAPVMRARALHLRAGLLESTGQATAGAPVALLQAAQVAAAADPLLTQEMLIDAIRMTFVSGHRISGITAAEVGRAVLAMNPPKGDESGIGALLLEGLATLVSVGYLEAAPILRRAMVAMADPDSLTGAVPRWHVLGHYAADCLWDEEANRSWAEKCAQIARRTGALPTLVMTLMAQSMQEARMGHLALADASAAEGRQLAHALGWNVEQHGNFLNPEVSALRGDHETALLSAQTYLAAAEALAVGDIDRQTYEGLAVSHLARGEYAQAFELAQRITNLDTTRTDNRALPILVEAGVRLDRRAEATAALAVLGERAVAAQTPWGLGLLARSGALLAADDAAEALFNDAVDVLKTTNAVIDVARSHLLYGEWLRRQRRRADSRLQLHLALEQFMDMGALAFADRARRELAATGERPAAAVATTASELTAQEVQVAKLAASGATNNEIATALFISSHTVDYHLSKVYRKLGVTSRRRLSAALMK